MARWWEAEQWAEEETPELKTYRECPKCKAAGDPGTTVVPWTWVTFVNGQRMEYAMSTPLCDACRAEMAGRGAPSYTGPTGGAGFSKYEFRSAPGPKYEPYVGLLDQARSSARNRGLPEVTR